MKKILVAEDEQNIREFVVINLKRAGYDAFEAVNGEQALGGTTAWKPQAVRKPCACTSRPAAILTWPCWTS